MPVSLHLIPVSHLNPTMFQIVLLSTQLQRAMHSAYALAKDLLADRGEATVLLDGSRQYCATESSQGDSSRAKYRITNIV